MLDAALLAGLNHLLDGANWARERLAPFAGRQAVVGTPPLRFALVVTDAGRFAVANPDASADVTIRLPPDAPFLLAQGIDRLMAQVHVEGNAEFATELSFVLRHLRWDYAEDLSHVFGDIAAQRIASGFARLSAIQQDVVQRFGDNLREYLVHESPALIGRVEHAAFGDELLRLHAAIDRLERRISP